MAVVALSFHGPELALAEEPVGEGLGLVVPASELVVWGLVAWVWQQVERLVAPVPGHRNPVAE